MAVLDAWAVTVMRNLGNQWQLLANAGHPWPGVGALVGPGKGNVACWNWALSGFGHVCVDPARMFDFVGQAQADPQLDPNLSVALGKEWFQARANMRKLRKIRDDFALNVDTNAAREAMIRLAAQANGLTVVGGGTNYQLKVYSTPNTPYPNWSHWWLDVYGATVEHFTNQVDVKIYTGGFAGGHALNAVTVDTFHLNGIHQLHKDRIQWILRNRADLLVLRHPSGNRQAWLADNNRNNCHRCHAGFGVFRRKHHCRVCGDIYCDNCSNRRAFVVLPATRPNNPNLNRSQDRVRVCRNCLPLP